MRPRITRLRFTALLVASVCAVGTAAHVIHKTDFSEKVTRSNKPLVAQNLHFGEAWATADFPWRVSLENTTDLPVHVADIRSSCACTTITPHSFNLAPKGCIGVNLVINLLGVRGSQHDSDQSAFSVEILPVNAYGHPLSLPFTVRGSVAQPVRITPSAVIFADGALVAGTTFEAATITVTEIGRVSDVRVEADKGLRAALVRESDSQWLINVAPCRMLDIGEFQKVIDLHLTIEDGQSLHPFFFRRAPGGSFAGLRTRLRI